MTTVPDVTFLRDTQHGGPADRQARSPRTWPRSPPPRRRRSTSRSTTSGSATPDWPDRRRRFWEPEPHDAAVLADWRTVAAHLARKNSTPYTPTSVHDFMHLKVLITDDELTTGSYNFSANAERNAENQIHLDDPTTVSAYADYITAVAAAYATA